MSAQSTGRIAVIGTGIAGAVIARRLADAGRNVVVFEKARGAGGRLSSRRSPTGGFDIGAQYFTAQSPAFQDQVESWLATGACAVWNGRFAERDSGTWRDITPTATRYVGTPGMHQIAKQLLGTIDVQIATRITKVLGGRRTWHLSAEDGRAFAPFTHLVVTTPAPQACDILRIAAPSLVERLAEVTYAPCWAVMAAFDSDVALPWDGIALSEGNISWIARDSSKPGRPPGERWVLHGASGWSADHLDIPESAVGQQALVALAQLAKSPLPAIRELQAHRWLYAQVQSSLETPCLWSAELGIGYAGDGCLGARVEAAWESGVALADAVLESLA